LFRQSKASIWEQWWFFFQFQIPPEGFQIYGSYPETLGVLSHPLHHHLWSLGQSLHLQAYDLVHLLLHMINDNLVITFNVFSSIMWRHNLSLGEFSWPVWPCLGWASASGVSLPNCSGVHLKTSLPSQSRLAFKTPESPSSSSGSLSTSRQEIWQVLKIYVISGRFVFVASFLQLF